MAHMWKSAILAIFLHSKHQKSYQGTLGTQELPPTGSMTTHGPSLGPTGSSKRTLWFSRFCKAVITFSKKYIILTLGASWNTFTAIVVLHLAQGPSWTPKWTLNFTLRGWCRRTLADQRPSRVPPRSKLINFFIDLKTTDKLKNTAWFEVNRTFGCREIIV